jgi:hypothetical protein
MRVAAVQVLWSLLVMQYSQCGAFAFMDGGGAPEEGSKESVDESLAPVYEHELEHSIPATLPNGLHINIPSDPMRFSERDAGGQHPGDSALLSPPPPSSPLLWSPDMLPNGRTLGESNKFSPLSTSQFLAGSTPVSYSTLSGPVDASVMAALQSNPALADAVRTQYAMKTGIGGQITTLERAVAARQQSVSAGIADLRRIASAVLLTQKDAYLARAQLGAAHRQLAALDVNTRRLTDTARLADLQKALSLTESTLGPSQVLTQTQRVVNAQLAATLKDQLTVTKAKIDAATGQIDEILGAKAVASSIHLFKEAEEKEAQAQKLWAEAQDLRAQAERSNVVRAYALASTAHELIDKAGATALSPSLPAAPPVIAATGTSTGASTVVAAATPSASPPAPVAPAPEAAPASFVQAGLEEHTSAGTHTSQRSHTSGHRLHPHAAHILSREASSSSSSSSGSGSRGVETSLRGSHV